MVKIKYLRFLTIDIIWPFEDGDSFSPECFFNNEDDLYEKFMILENDNE